MKKFNVCLIALVTSFSSFALAADLAPNTPFYIELGTGASVNSAKEWSGESALNANATSHKTGSAVSTAIGFIYSPNVRFDFNLTYIPQWNINKYYTTSDTGQAASYNTNLNSLVTTFNAYYDITQLSSQGLTPYVMAGIGMSNNQVNNVDVYIGQEKASTLYGSNKYNFAWNLGAGANYQVSERISVGMGYKFSSLGKVSTSGGYQQAYDEQINQVIDKSSAYQLTFKNIYAQQIMANVRLKF